MTGRKFGPFDPGYRINIAYFLLRPIQRQGHPSQVRVLKSMESQKCRICRTCRKKTQYLYSGKNFFYNKKFFLYIAYPVQHPTSPTQAHKAVDHPARRVLTGQKCRETLVLAPHPLAKAHLRCDISKNGLTASPNNFAGWIFWCSAVSKPCLGTILRYVQTRTTVRRPVI